MNTTNEVNPYEPPKVQSSSPPTCNFCGKSPRVGSLVQAPEQDVYICASCARVASRTIKSHETPSWTLSLKLIFGMVLFLFGVTALLITSLLR